MGKKQRHTVYNPIEALLKHWLVIDLQQRYS